jgi:hypothetical protein
MCYLPVGNDIFSTETVSPMVQNVVAKIIDKAELCFNFH